VKCGSDSAVIGLNISDRPYFQSALHSREFALSDYLIRRVSGVPGVMAMFPVMKEGGVVTTSVIVASLDLRWIGELAANAAQGAGTEVFVIDGGGTVLAASAEEEQLVGKNLQVTS
jgi:C4-dicarboxylate-specific signal transduction histidine kinase